MNKLHEIVEYWQGLDDNQIDQHMGEWEEGVACCHGAHMVHYLTECISFASAQKELANYLGGNEAQVLLMMRRAGSPRYPWGCTEWEREKVYANLLKVEELPSVAGASLRKADFYMSDLSGADLSGADLSHSILNCADLSDADLSNASLRISRLHSANLTNANLSNADLFSVQLRRANLSGANLSGADLSFANLSGATLDGASFQGANMNCVDLSGTELEHS